MKSHVENILQHCINHKLAETLTKCEFHVHKMILLGHILDGSQVQMDGAKCESIRKWPVPTKTNEVQAFQGFPNYYRRFIVNHSAKVGPLIDLTNDVSCSWRH